MAIKLKRIIFSEANPNNRHPSYDNQLQPRMIFAGDELEKLFRDQEDDILETVSGELFAYVNNDLLCNNDANMFPRCCLLTGDWYLREVYFDSREYLSVSAALLGNSLGYADDYLGLEVVLCFDEGTQAFKAVGINSESI